MLRFHCANPFCDTQGFWKLFSSATRIWTIWIFWAGEQQAWTSHQVITVDSALFDSLRLFDLLGCFGFCMLLPGFNERVQGFADGFSHGRVAALSLSLSAFNLHGYPERRNSMTSWNIMNYRNISWFSMVEWLPPRVWIFLPLFRVQFRDPCDQINTDDASLGLFIPEDTSRWTSRSNRLRGIASWWTLTFWNSLPLSCYTHSYMYIYDM